jgi:type VI secretion system protein ImpC
MTIKSSFGEVKLDVNAGADPSPAVPDPETPFRILLLGDFSGAAARAARPQAGWKPRAIDRDNFDEVLARVGPEFSGLRFREIDDFHPDRIYTENEIFQRLRDVRRMLEEPATFGEAAAEIRSLSKEQSAPATPPTTARTASAAEPERPLRPELAPGASLLDSIVEAEEPKAPAAVIRRGELRSFVESVVAPYRVAAENTELPRLRELADAEAGVRMRSMLHHAAFQALEAAWRAVFQLVRATETGSLLQIYLADVSKAELAADLGAADDLRKSRAWRMLVEETGGDGWSLVAGNYAFAQTVDDAEMLGRLAKIMSHAGAPFLAEADPGGGTEAGEGTRQWERLRQLPEASWIGLAMPRLLLRLPYGKKTDTVESFEFEEMPGVPNHQEYLWGNPAFACVQVLAEAFANSGWEMRPGAGAQIDGLPLHVYEAEGEQQVKPCAEVLLTERELDWILDRGYMPLASIRDRDAVRLVRFQSIAKPLARLSGRWE